jgi:uncharacterized protein (TIGR02466 family)
LDNYNTIPLFSTPVYTSKIDIPKENQDNLKRYEYDRMDNGSASYTKDRKILNLPEFSLLKSRVMEHINTYGRDVLKIKPEIELYITTSWINKFEPKDYGGIHSHVNAIISGVLYLDVSEKSGDLCLAKDPGYINTFSQTIDIEYSEWNIFNSKTWYIHPENNMIVMFPAHLSHRINANLEDKNRYSLAFNVFVRGNFGTKECHLEIK